MSEKQRLSTNEHTKILVPASSYDMAKDSRLLIPFTSGEKIGFVNRDGIVVVKPEYTMYYGEFYNEQDLVKVAIDYTYGFIRSGGKVATYRKPLYGLINVKGEMVLNAEYSEIVPSIGGGLLFTVQKNGQYGVLDASGMEIVPFGRYGYIDGFDRGLARVKIGTTTNGVMNNGCRWGILTIPGKRSCRPNTMPFGTSMVKVAIQQGSRRETLGVISSSVVFWTKKRGPCMTATVIMTTMITEFIMVNMPALMRKMWQVTVMTQLTMPSMVILMHIGI